MHHRRADIERLYVKEENDRKKWIQQELTDKTTTMRLKDYLDTTID